MMASCAVFASLLGNFCFVFSMTGDKCADLHRGEEGSLPFRSVKSLKEEGG